MGLQTPKIIDRNSTFPGENWFYYWKTSSSLWESKLEEFEYSEILVPINWAFHYVDNYELDFGKIKPEADLLKLISIIHKLNKKVHFILQIGPIPSLVNGGVPHQFAISKSINKQGLIHCIASNENTIINLYSFYEYKVFKNFRVFIKSLSDLFKEVPDCIKVWGGEFFYFSDEHFYSYMDDYSFSFENAFRKFIQNSSELEDLSADKEIIAKKEFKISFRELYTAMMSEFLEEYWCGDVTFLAVGSSWKDLIRRALDKENFNSFVNQSLEAASFDIIPFTGLISNLLNDHVVTKLFKENFYKPFSYKIFNRLEYTDEEDTSYSLIKNFFIYTDNSFDFISEMLPDQGLIDFLNLSFPGQIKFFGKKLLDDSEMTQRDDDFYFFTSAKLEEENYYKVLKIFMNGGQVFLNRSCLDDRLKQKIESFVLENNLEKISLNFHGEISQYILGNGKMILFDSENFKNLEVSKKISFWSNIIESIGLSDMKLVPNPNLRFIWKRRYPTSSELKFEEIRRVSIYNLSSYKVEYKIKDVKNYAFLKTLDSNGVNVNKLASYIELSFSPESSISLDFGIYS